MKRFEIIDFVKLKAEGNKFVVSITHRNKAGNMIAYLYPFKDSTFAENFATECIDYAPEIFELNDELKELIAGKKYEEAYLSSIKDLYARASYFDNAEINFIMFDKDLNAIDVNESMLRNYRTERGHLIGKNYSELSSSATDNGLYDQFLEVIRTGESFTVEEVKGDVRYGEHYYRLKAFKVGNGIGVSLSNIDKLKNMIKALEYFVYKSSHDIRSPITGSLGLLNLAIKAEEKDPEILHHYISLIRSQLERLDDFTRMSLESIKLEKQERVAEEINFNTLIAEVKQTLSFIDGFNEIKFQEIIDEINGFFFDKTTLTFLFQNLIDNAIKYRKRDIAGEAYVKIDINQADNHIAITIADNGIGIAAEHQQQIFDIFFRANGMIPGTGLGLYTLKQSIEKLGGTISMKSKENEGTIFTVILPKV